MRFRNPFVLKISYVCIHLYLFIQVYCDQKTAGGGWTVFQKRQDSSVNFFQGWNDYKNGFGDLNGEFWLGLDKIHRLTKARNCLRVDLEDTEGKTAYAEYGFFAVANEQGKYNAESWVLFR